MQQSILIEPSSLQKHLIIKENEPLTAKIRLTFNISDIDGIFPGFRVGDFAVLYGPQSITSLISLLCVRAQLPKQLGGLESNVIFIDCSSNYSPSNIERYAQHQHLGNETALGRIHNTRVYTAYRLTSFIMEKLHESVETHVAKIVVISDIAGPFLYENQDNQEATAVYSQIMSYLSNYAKKHQIIIIATYLSHESNERNNMLQKITTAKANTVLRFTKTPYTKEVELEKHPSYILGVVDLTSENQALTDFMCTGKESSNYFLM